ncbi:hypothetical protein CEXT_595481 [Caerostris extrusa]|uniref:Uncharacterized protein n=1 Tax=Caerostris extrusa TaxID=172846 RepID=A0AAV4XYY4_CAEEX|nr:hypothetical protein CEXT_595481 [Caerostris extrusa]
MCNSIKNLHRSILHTRVCLGVNYHNASKFQSLIRKLTADLNFIAFCHLNGSYPNEAIRDFIEYSPFVETIHWRILFTPVGGWHALVEEGGRGVSVECLCPAVTVDNRTFETGRNLHANCHSCT